jgi:hypothetical protein
MEEMSFSSGSKRNSVGVQLRAGDLKPRREFSADAFLP